MILRNLLALVAIIFISWNSCYTFAAEQDYLAVVQRQSTQIKELKTRLDALEKTVSAMQTKTVVNMLQVEYKDSRAVWVALL